MLTYYFAVYTMQHALITRTLTSKKAFEIAKKYGGYVKAEEFSSEK